MARGGARATWRRGLRRGPTAPRCSVLGVLRRRRGCGRAACHQYGVLYLYCVQCQACDEGVMMIYYYDTLVHCAWMGHIYTAGTTSYACRYVRVRLLESQSAYCTGIVYNYISIARDRITVDQSQYISIDHRVSCSAICITIVRRCRYEARARPAPYHVRIGSCRWWDRIHGAMRCPASPPAAPARWPARLRAAAAAHPGQRSRLPKKEIAEVGRGATA